MAVIHGPRRAGAWSKSLEGGAWRPEIARLRGYGRVTGAAVVMPDRPWPTAARCSPALRDARRRAPAPKAAPASRSPGTSAEARVADRRVHPPDVARQLLRHRVPQRVMRVASRRAPQPDVAVEVRRDRLQRGSSSLGVQRPLVPIAAGGDAQEPPGRGPATLAHFDDPQEQARDRPLLGAGHEVSHWPDGAGDGLLGHPRQMRSSATEAAAIRCAARVAPPPG